MTLTNETRASILYICSEFVSFPSDGAGLPDGNGSGGSLAPLSPTRWADAWAVLARGASVAGHRAEEEGVEVGSWSSHSRAADQC